ncbi:hypothetical protein LCGC14_2748010 [marine sediment metagenome]|uniref:Uncharacterized protein n=1 Tax=marine sediment metagenome TaxID=412755 RepID=A0A0F9BU97_9ZZZZ
MTFSEQEIADLKGLDQICEVEGHDCWAHYLEVEAKDGIRCDKCEVTFPPSTPFHTFFVVRERKTITRWPCGCVSIRDVDEVPA